MTSKKRGPLYVLTAAVLWSLAGVCAKYIPWHPLSIACARGTIAAVTILCLRRSLRVRLNASTLLAALCMNATTVLFMFSNKMTTAANAIVFQYTAPIYVILLAVFVLRKKTRPVEIVTVLLTVLGILLFFLDHLGQGKLLGDLVGLLSGVTFAGVFFFNSLPDAAPGDASLLGCALSALLLPFLLGDPQVSAGGPVPWLVALFLGVCQLGLAYYFFSLGVQETGAVASSILCAAEPILNPIWVFLATGERPGTAALVGAALVVVTIAAYNIITARQCAAEAEPAAPAPKEELAP